jgi:hypothetical protein
MKRLVPASLFVVPVLCAVACGDDDVAPTPTPTVDGGQDVTTLSDAGVDAQTGPCAVAAEATYDDTDFAANAAPATALLARFDALLDPMKKAELDLAIKPTSAELQGLFTIAAPSLQANTSPAFAGYVTARLDAFAAAAGTTWVPANPPTGNGGKYGAYIFDEKGGDLRQLAEKGMFGATHYRTAAQLVANDAGTAAVVDQVITLFGANPSWPRNDKAGDGGVVAPDRYSAVYAKRRDKGEAPTGLYVTMRRDAIVARTLSGKAECVTSRKDSLERFMASWEKSLAATSIYYLADASKKFQTAATSGSATDFASALHGYNEAVAFLRGFRGSDARQTIPDATIDDILGGILAPPEGTTTSYLLVTDTASNVGKLEAAIPKIAAAYGFTADQVTAFKVNY